MKAVLITGAAGGIGSALVRVFSDAGYGVIATDLAARPADLPCEHYFACDLRRTVEDESFASEVFSGMRKVLDGRPLAALINNAAIQLLGPADTLSREDWRATLDVNLLAPFLWAQAFLPELEAARGVVLNMSSIHARLTKPSFIAYATSKAALTGMTRAMAVELGARVRINAIEPAAIDTPMLRAGFAGNPSGFDLLKNFHPSRSIGSAEGLARLAVSIVRSEDIFTNGSIIPLDGGIGNQLHDPGC
ncbi:SDR family NAD(P)-dependent oxidoreductase [Luteimonas soli]|uniref:SDR family NAD(P)-dependent oxidoreductase n=1 Tax=Luteimonas soli TaxID=1648966 RepID=A0ABV7XG81_9GAMM